MNTLATHRVDSSSQEDFATATSLAVAWVGPRHQWLELDEARSELEDVELVVPAGLQNGRKLSGLPADPDLFHVAGSQLVDVSQLRTQAPASAIVLDLSHGAPKRRWAARMLTRQLAAADLVIVGSALELREARWRVPELAQRIVRLDRPLDLSRHASPGKLLRNGSGFREFRQANALEGRVLVFAGPFSARGGLDAAVAAAARLAATVQDVTLVAIRQGEIDGRYFKRCRRQAEALGLRALLVDDPRPEEVPFWYAAASVVCLPSRDSAGAEPARHAAAAARPIVGSEVDTLLDQVVDGETGILVPVDDHRALVDAIAALLTNDRERRRLGQLARRHMEVEASPARAGAGLRRLWSQAIGRRRESGGAGARR